MTALEGSRDQLRRLAVLIAASGIDMIGFAMVFPLLPLYARDLNATPEEIGVLLAAYSVAQLLMAPIWGRVSDRYGRRPALLIGLSAAAAAYLVFAFADSFWLLLLSRLVQGAGGGTTAVAQAYVADTIQPSDRARALGWLSAASSLGVAIGPVFGSTAAHWGQAGPGLIAAGLCFVNVAFAW
ncbi:MAG TPA: MFS transporter, partial [Gemmatimonadales bacterium]